jgi:hydroxypyruvate isomerase
MAGVVASEATVEERERYRRTFVRNLAFAAAEAAPQGVTVLIEPINPRDMPGYFLTHQAQAQAIREEVGAANLKVQMDCYHCQVVEGDIAAKFLRWQPHIGHLQIAGNPGRHEPDVGEIHYPYLFQLFDRSGYDGWVGCEYRPADGTRDGLGWLYRLLERPAVRR